MTPALDLKFAEELADIAGAIIRGYFRGNYDSETKAHVGDSPVTQADREAEAAMRARIEAAFPEDGIIGEEYGTVRADADRVWVLDPIDGTVSFIAGRPIFGTLVAQLRGGFPVLGVIDQPINRERWAGAIGGETRFMRAGGGDEDRPARTRRCPELKDAILATSGPNYFSRQEGEQFMALAAQVAHPRMVYGGDCYNYGLLTSGYIDLVVETGLKLHDYAALVPVVEGAGGMMCDWDGDPLTADSDGRVIALGDPARLEDVLAALRSAG
ncbi:inositol monophosphatase family protein [Pacificimonas sp. WHA3]|uniref:Inositol monophosphatase family protein n=1 Tax=Pacificimonas pallii TaxID=2827236 RepID=A0ABS6SCS5_9SPHN|nr:inositol monophosphatase family protein [Pacificimonas pallii]MBV7255716.1 inositol monophosphatase family protein [Pacificimonas pallii]